MSEAPAEKAKKEADETQKNWRRNVKKNRQNMMQLFDDSNVNEWENEKYRKRKNEKAEKEAVDAS